MGRMTKIRTAGVAALAAALLVGCGSDGPDARLSDAHDECDLGRRPAEVVRLAGDGQTLVLDGKGGDGGLGVTPEDYVCVLSALGAPHGVLAKMDSTRALDGQQSDEWDGITATWTYHPDEGLDVILETGRASG